MIDAIYKIGKAVSGNQEPIDCMLESLKVEKSKKDKKGNVTEIKNYILKIVFDLADDKIIISSDNLIVFDGKKSRKRFVYCENNKGKERQFYVTRVPKSSKYLMGETLSRLLDKTEDVYKDSYETNSLHKIVKKVTKSPLYDWENQEINLKKIEGMKDDYLKLSPLQLIKKLIKLDRNEKIVLVTLAVREGEQTDLINIAEMDEYKALVLTKLKRKIAKSANNKGDYCYLCKERKPSSSKNLKNVKRMRLFTTTAISSASDLKHYDKNYRICSECLKKLRAGEGFVNDNMGISIAETPTLLIPKILSFEEEISPEYFERLHSKVDIAFREEKFDAFIKSVEDSAENDEEDLQFTLDFLSYETDGKYFKVINHIHDVPEFYFSKVAIRIAENYLKYEREIKGKFDKGFGLSSIYSLIPIKYKQDGRISDTKNKALLFYSQLLGGRRIEKDVVFSYFCEAMYHLCMNQQSVYKNLRYYAEDSFDFAVKDYFYRYLVLVRTLEDLNLVDKEEPLMEEGKSEIKTSEEMEAFLSENKFGEPQRALFYLGTLINQVGYSQSLKGHKHKPILKKITYQGMSSDDLKRLYVDTFEKLVQYEALKYSDVEKFNSLCKYYFDKSDASWELSEFENVFYLLSGYAYKVANPSKNEEASPSESEDVSDNDNNKGVKNE
ncbi:type I-B CRISPR-associated protein Cas8b/Csh1 [Desulfobacterales bacterium HSG2]|nr:type I-B CRISPR-associated protein Cas8b/Csh1 [Desulfobacterales bacterium HSG2]